MTQEEKLLLKDLCTRLPYRVKGIITYDESNTTFTVEGIDNNVLHLSDAEECYVEDFKPYLRPMSSITTNEEYEYHQIRKRNSDKSLTLMGCSDHLQQLLFPIIVGTESIDWLNAHHFDYRGLIEKGLALEAPEGMYD